MTAYPVTKVRKERSSDGTHRHIAGVITNLGMYYTRHEVVTSLAAGNTWHTSVDGRTTAIKAITYCPSSSCLSTPYIKTEADNTSKDNLENLPEG